MDGSIKGLELSREPKHWSSADITKVRRMRQQGHSNSDIAKAVGVSAATLSYFLGRGKFGRDLPSRKGQRGIERKSRLPDCEISGRILGTTDWKSRQDKIKNGWTDEEAKARQEGKLPNRTDNNSLFKK